MRLRSNFDRKRGNFRASLKGCVFSLSLGAFAYSSIARAVEIPRDRYLRYLPIEYPKLVQQNPATQEMDLYGNPNAPEYRDQLPKDGIDDQRAQVLKILAVRFAPYMVQNTTAFPMDFKKIMEIQNASILNVDQWEITDIPQRVIESDSVDLTGLYNRPCPKTRGSTPEEIVESEDCKLLGLLRQFDPYQPANLDLRSGSISPKSSTFSVLYFNFLGSSPMEWRNEYKSELSGKIPEKYQGTEKVYVHPFVNETTASYSHAGQETGSRSFEFVLQYWFFYPWNDGGNKHEGDWEHLGVVISPLSKIGKPLSAKDIQEILMRTERGLRDEDPLVISRLDYYMHNEVMPIPFSDPNVYLPRRDWERTLGALSPERVGEKEVLKQIRRLAWADREERIFNTHPIVYIGADSKGLELILSPPGARNKDSHASYPFPALYKNIGPVAAAEEIHRKFNHQKRFQEPEKPLPDYVKLYADPNLLELVPDWERIHPMIYEDPEVRRNWYWMLLPIRWGYPAISSPFAGIVAHAETGNISPVGPTNSKGWNRPGTSASFGLYLPQRYSGIIPTGPLDYLRNDFGFLNALILPLTTLPPFDAIVRIGGLPIRAATGYEQIFYPIDRLPFRFVTLEGGVSTQFLDDEQWPVLFVNDQQLSQIDARADAVDPNPGTLLDSFSDNPSTPLLGLSFHLSPHFTTENTIRHSNSEVGVDVGFASRPQPFLIRGNLDFWEYTGTIRYNLLTRSFQPYFKLGWGLSWYRLTNVTTDGSPLATPDSAWIRKPSIFPLENILPNTWHLGAGIEWIPIWSVSEIPKGIDFGLKVDVLYSQHSLGLTANEVVLGGLDTAPTIHRFAVNILATLGL